MPALAPNRSRREQEPVQPPSRLNGWRAPTDARSTAHFEPIHAGGLRRRPAPRLARSHRPKEPFRRNSTGAELSTKYVDPHSLHDLKTGLKVISSEQPSNYASWPSPQPYLHGIAGTSIVQLGKTFAQPEGRVSNGVQPFGGISMQYGRTKTNPLHRPPSRAPDRHAPNNPGD